MLSVYRLMGPWGIILLVLILVNVCLVGWSVVKLSTNGHHKNPSLEGKINAVLFWGAMGAVLGVLGQLNGIYLALRVILAAAEIDPAVVAEGFAISFLPTLFGLALLAGSALAWFVLRAVYGRMTRVPEAL